MRLLAILLGIIAALITLIIGVFILSPRPSAWLVNQLFKEGVAVPPENYSELQNQTTIKENIKYDSRFASNVLDVISPKTSDGPLPTIIWVHGGAFVGGDKKDITEYAVMLAANGYHVVNANYELAPSAKYPSPLLQLNDIYAFIKEEAEHYGFDLNQIYFAGDSAGAQIVSQYALIQTNAEYAKNIEIPAVVPAATIKGMLLYCGPYDIAQLSHLSDNRLVAFLLGRVGWAYIGERDWVNSETAELASTKDFVTESYPPTFITDGNDMTFTEHGKALAEALKNVNVQTTSLFFPRDQQILPHEFQFIFDYPEAHETFDATLQFLKDTSSMSKD